MIFLHSYSLRNRDSIVTAYELIESAKVGAIRWPSQGNRMDLASKCGFDNQIEVVI